MAVTYYKIVDEYTGQPYWVGSDGSIKYTDPTPPAARNTKPIVVGDGLYTFDPYIDLSRLQRDEMTNWSPGNVVGYDSQGRGLIMNSSGGFDVMGAGQDNLGEGGNQYGGYIMSYDAQGNPVGDPRYQKYDRSEGWFGENIEWLGPALVGAAALFGSGALGGLGGGSAAELASADAGMMGFSSGTGASAAPSMETILAGGVGGGDGAWLGAFEDMAPVPGYGSEWAVAGVEGFSSQAATTAYAQVVAAGGTVAQAATAADLAAAAATSGAAVPSAVSDAVKTAMATGATTAATTATTQSGWPGQTEDIAPKPGTGGGGDLGMGGMLGLGLLGLALSQMKPKGAATQTVKYAMPTQGAPQLPTNYNVGWSAPKYR